jgi:hypothetical protein
MSNSRRITLTIVAACMTAATLSYVRAADKLENIPLEWSPTEPMSERKPIDLTGLEAVKLQVETFTDTRDDPASIGRSLNKAPVRKVTTRTNVPRFVTYQVKALLSDLGLDVVESSGTVVMNGEVRQFFAEDDTRYKATVELRITLSDPSGKPLWVVNTTGTSSRFGIAYKAANYYEVLSDALIGAVHELAGNANFKKTLKGK